MAEFEQRDGESRLPFDPATVEADAGLIFIGAIRSPWKERKDCPKNLSQARERGKTAMIEINKPFRPGLDGLKEGNLAHILSWLDRAPRNLIAQRPRHLETARGTFALRSPVRPNPIGLHTVRLISVDIAAGLVEIDAIDLIDGTPVLDLKPYYPTTDSLHDRFDGESA
ncbi:tRNA (N6-threonylcarbamoyladenosine(37)-N6)-methyltransferase TrmO [Notoacmeibacter sp. MSK16QG-6]|uniref:tRNA (N6-threonylcarbamoyladenosine(37)-N6)-methyltransferase TrmO n=1 Tax=Notoacmeibacter sp. MSK16QG-6 TaxID=2957982 RepID=UPI0020A0AA15|nr:tRNA (N6-threonylcarbamoyladenosine(37)-N6)-methyltransferase TrmO [Notoacmeibacter sp. MSK16QG-6]MCP1199728.1 tRNA (N6-threonylcarbamoyladenosine(37)-N6)-methyltransferase TrmO [Notoacmeibacter sp. MSK16QG-6]